MSTIENYLQLWIMKVEYFIVEWLQEWLCLHISAHFLLMWDVRRSPIVSGLWATKPPFLHDNAWLTVNIFPQAQ